MLPLLLLQLLLVTRLRSGSLACRASSCLLRGHGRRRVLGLLLGPAVGQLAYAHCVVRLRCSLCMRVF